jgi:cytosine/adenosine deaminase-related metal-dependent hydrolase
MMRLILKNVIFIDWNTLIFKQTNIKIEEGVNGSIHFFDDFSKIEISKKDEVLDCEGKLVTKSFAIGHHHAYSALARGMPAPKRSPASFVEILKYIWWNLDKNLDKKTIEASALATAIDCAKAGSTFVIDHHASPNFIEGSLDIVADAFDKVGVSHLLCYEISDRDGKQKALEGLEETNNYLSQHHGLVGLHASFTLSDSTLKKAADLIQKYDSGIHIHVAEDNYDQEDSIRKYNKRVVERLNDFGFLNSSKTILAHCLHINEKERKSIKESSAFVVQNTESNLNNGVGYFNSDNLGSRIMLGTDGMHSDMIRSARSAYFVGQSTNTTSFADIYKRFRMIHNYLDINSFHGDGNNNLLVLDYDSPTEINEDNFLGHFIFGLSSDHVQHVISNGQLIVKNKILQKIDETVVMDFCRHQAKRLWKKL